MENPWLILIVLVPAYFAVALIATLVGVCIAPLLRVPRSRFFEALRISLAAGPIALIAYIATLGMLSSILPSGSNQIPKDTDAGFAQLYWPKPAPLDSNAPQLSLDGNQPFVLELGSGVGQKASHSQLLPATSSSSWFFVSLAGTLCIALVAAFYLAFHSPRRGDEPA